MCAYLIKLHNARGVFSIALHFMQLR